MSGSFLHTAPLPAFSQLNRIRIMRLYRRALKLQMSWTPRYDIFRGEAMEIRRRFEAKLHITDPRMIAKLVSDAEEELYENRHPDPYIRMSHYHQSFSARFGRIEWLTRGFQLQRLQEDRNGNGISPNPKYKHPPTQLA
jgi:NADH dehydrogenase (ubiquinone) 1 beta subcomplex subunit 9